MRRRELVAGVGSVGVLGGAAGVVLGGAPSFGDDPATADADGESELPARLETIDARGSEAGTVTVPNDGVSVVMFFVTGCGNCQAQMPRLAEARSRLVGDYGDELTFLSLTYQSFDAVPEDELREWWRTHSGNWYVGYDDDSALTANYNVYGYPVTIVVDSQGEKHWESLGVASSDEIVEAVEAVFESREAAAESESAADENETTTA